MSDCEIKEEVLDETTNNNPIVVTLPLDVYNEQLDAIKALQTDVTFIKEQIQFLIQQGTPAVPSNRYFDSIKELMPLESINALIKFDDSLGNDENRKKFELFLASFVLFKKPLKEMTMAFIETVYALELQAQVNYLGAGDKQALKSLCSTQVLIKALVDHSLFDNTDDPATQACAEFRYQMQHACDRIRSNKRKQSEPMNRKRIGRQKMSIPLEAEFRHAKDEDEDTEM